MTFPSISLFELNTDHSFDITNRQTGPLSFKSMVTTHKVEFKAFIESINTSFRSSWNTENVYGRMDPVATFQNTQRTISISWTIPAANLSEAQHNLNAVTSLSSMLYPGYKANPINVDGNVFSTANSISRSPLIKMKFANLINSKDDDGLLGYVDGFDHQIEVSMGFFIKDKKMYPKVIKLSCNFTVLHQHDLGFNEKNDWIGSDVGSSNWVYGNDLKLSDSTAEDEANTTGNTSTAQASNNKNAQLIADVQASLEECVARLGGVDNKECGPIAARLKELKAGGN